MYSSSENQFFSEWRIEEFAEYGHGSQPNSATMCVFNSVVNSPVGSGAKPQLPTILVHFKRRHFLGVARIVFFFKKHMIWSKYKPKLGVLASIFEGFNCIYGIPEYDLLEPFLIPV